MGLIQYDFSPYKKRKLGTQKYIPGHGTHEDTARGMPSTSQGEEVSGKNQKWC